MESTRYRSSARTGTVLIVGDILDDREPHVEEAALGAAVWQVWVVMVIVLQVLGTHEYNL